MGKINFDFNLLKNAVVEKDVENAYRTLFSKLFTKYGLTSPFGCDGYLTDENGLDVLCEFKYSSDLKSKVEQVKILSQTLYYLKKFYTTGTQLPKAIFVGDTNECFVIHVNPLTKYLDYNLDWSIAPSSAHKNNPQLIQDMLDDEQINPFVFQLRDDFVWEAISRKLIDLSTNVKRLVKVTDSNIVEVFEYFCENVLDKKSTLNAHDKASLFISRLIDDKDIYLHPKRKGCLITKDFGEVKVNEQNYINFFEHFDGSQYSIREKENLVKITDRIIEDDKRRRSGDFFTPAIWVDEAHKMISEQFGEDWKEKYVVWDPAWGTGNLTRDYKFKELYCSTLHQSEIDVANSNRVNSESVKFQYDFLNDGIIDGKIDVENDPKLPQGLKDAILGGKEIIVLMNPPYGTANEMGTDSEHKSGMALTKLNKLMKDDDWGASSQQLYAQFLYKIFKYQQICKNIRIGVFSPPLFLSGGSYKKFRENFFNKFGFERGFLFEACNFSDVAKNWGISFTLFGNKIKEQKFILNVIDFNENFELETLYSKEIYNTDNYNKLSDFTRFGLKGLKTFDSPQMTSAINIKQEGRGTIIDHNFYLGTFHTAGNALYKNATDVGLYTSCNSNGNSHSISITNFKNSLVGFLVRKSVLLNWVNCKDEYIIPIDDVINSDKYKQFEYDSIVYSLFNTSSNQSSMRQVDYKDKKWDIKNEFFWMSKNDMMELADQNGFDDLYHDAKGSNERYVYELLFGEQRIYDKLSPDAKEVLDMATHLVKKTFKLRKTLHDLKPEYHLNTWDAGFYQIKLVLKEYFQMDMVRFSHKYKEFEDRLRPLVYELGFLKQ